jgi:SPX domain protein involved in polyphosphate accumulation
MPSKDTSPSLQDFSLIKTHVDKIAQDQGLSKTSLGFVFFALDLILGLQEDEIENAITDTTYLFERGKEKGHDRGIDALYIDESELPATVHLFNFKYTEQFKSTTNHFPSGEIDKITIFLRAMMQQDECLDSTINKHLSSKVQDIWNLFSNQNPRFVVHLCANFYNGFEPQEQKRFEREVGKFSNFSIEYHLIPWIVSSLTRKGKQVVNARIRAIDKNLFGYPRKAGHLTLSTTSRHDLIALPRSRQVFDLR